MTIFSSEREKKKKKEGGDVPISFSEKAE